MKTEKEILGRIDFLRGRLKRQEDERKRHARETGANRTTLGIRRTRELEGEIAGLEWVLGSDSGTQG
jgi:hypothetical protein